MRCSVEPSFQVTSPSGVIAVTSAPVTIVAPASRAARASSPETAPMPPTGHVPVAGAAADHVVQEAAVAVQVGVDVGCERADERVGEHDAAHEVARELALDRLTDRRLDEIAPHGVVAERALRLGAREQWLGHGREQRLRDALGAAVEAAPGRGVAAERRVGAARGRRDR